MVQRNSKKSFLPIKNVIQPLVKNKNVKLYELRKVQKQREVLMSQKLRERGNNQPNVISDKINKFHKVKERNRSVIKSQLDDQQSKLKNRLAKRREKSITRSF